MSPISSVSAGATSPAYRAAGSPTPTVGASDLGGAGQSLAASSAGGTMASSLVSQVQSTVSQLLQTVGSGLDGNQTLKTLFALLVIMALLQDLQKSTESGGNQLEQLGGGLNGRAQYVEMYSSTTTLTIQQSTTTMVVGSFEASAANDGSGAGQGEGIDVSA